MAYKARILPTAEAELESISAYLLQFGPATAARFLDEYGKQLDLLASGVVDYGFAKVPSLAARGYRACLVNSYVMLYYREDDEIVVAHIFHQSQDYARLVVS